MACLEETQVGVLKSEARRRVKNDSSFLRVQIQYGCKMFVGIVAADMPPACSSLVFLTVKEDV